VCVVIGVVLRGGDPMLAGDCGVVWRLGGVWVVLMRQYGRVLWVGLWSGVGFRLGGLWMR